MTIDKQALREAAERAMHDDWGYDTDIFHEQVTPSVVLALLDECAALAAENEELKYQEPTLAAMMSCLDAFYADEDVPERAMMAAYNILRKSISTPDTDVFLAEVRASELDSLAGVAETMLVKLSNQLCSSDMHEVVGWKMVLQQATNRAAQLRKGATL